MKFLSKAIFIIYQASSLLSLATACIADVFNAGNPSKKRDTRSGKCESMEKNLFAFKKELDKFQEKTKLAKALQEEEKVHDSPAIRGRKYGVIKDQNMNHNVKEDQEFL